MDYSSRRGPFGALGGSQLPMDNGLQFVCQVIQQYLSAISHEQRPYFVACINQILVDGMAKPAFLAPTSPVPPTFYREESPSDIFSLLQRRSSLPGFYDSVPGPYEQAVAAEPPAPESPKENIAFRTIPCRNWIKYKGNCRLGSKCKFIHDPDFITYDDNEDFPVSPTPHCWSYLQGTCIKDSDCKYYHPPQSHLRIYQRYTPCRDWETCTRLSCSFRHAPLSANGSRDSSPTSSYEGGVLDGDRAFGFRVETSAVAERPGLSSRSHGGATGLLGNGFNPHLSLDPIEEEFGTDYTMLSGTAASRRKSMIPTQSGSSPAKAQFDFGGFGNFDLHSENTTARPRGRSFDVSFMLPTKREFLPRDLA